VESGPADLIGVDALDVTRLLALAIAAMASSSASPDPNRYSGLDGDVSGSGRVPFIDAATVHVPVVALLEEDTVSILLVHAGSSWSLDRRFASDLLRESVRL